MIRAQFAVLMLALCCSVSVGQETVEPEASYLNPLLINQWISLDANNSISGKLVALDEAGEAIPRPAVDVSLVQKGKTLSRAVTDADGTFSFSNIAAGSYSFVAQSEYSFAAFGIHVLPKDSGSPNSFEACVTAVSATAARELLSENWVPSESEAPRFFEKDPLAGSRVVSTSSKVLLQDGGLVGQVSRAGVPLAEQDLTGNVAHIIKEGRSIAAAPVGRDGKFRIVSLDPGVYDLAVVGDDGTAMIGFEAVGPKPIASRQANGAVRFVSIQDTANQITVELADTADVAQQPEEVPSVPQDTDLTDAGITPFMGGGFSSPGMGGFSGGSAGGGGGGGAGLGAGGGLGGLLGIAGLAVGVAAISGDDNFDPSQASLISP
ncbi:MAG: carboxypeptidase-like regulatory domain-containing protein [Pirellulaceae bacterium]|nr:carboxypeptidase-like regulatory domain-containing protein [Pirellulaceae bacterium]